MKTPVDISQAEPQGLPAASFYAAESYRPEDSVGYLMRQILNSVAHHVEHQLAHADLTNAQWVPLFKMLIGKSSTVAGLARECNMDTGAMTRLLDRLEAKGLCSRLRSEEDRRVVNIALTDVGRAAAQNIPGALCHVQNAHLAGFSDEEFQMLKGFLHRILDNATTFDRHVIATPPTTGGPNAA
jgi:DNA-binding MarR family transcriptional regulator